MKKIMKTKNPSTKVILMVKESSLQKKNEEEEIISWIEFGAAMSSLTTSSPFSSSFLKPTLPKIDAQNQFSLTNVAIENNLHSNRIYGSDPNQGK